MKTRGYFLILLLTAIFGLNSCKEELKKNDPNAGFTQKPSGVFYKLITIGDGNTAPRLGDSLRLKLVFKNDSGVIVYNSSIHSYNGYVGMLMKEKMKYGTLDECFSMLNEGDSAHFKLNSEVVYNHAFNIGPPPGVNKNSLLTVEAKLEKIKTAAQIKTDSISYANWCLEMHIVEEKRLEAYIAEKKLNQLPDSNGLIITGRKQSWGPAISGGKTIFVNYIGKFLDGTVFDNTYLTKEPLEYKVGTPDQLITGLELIVRTMRIGEKVTVIIPSHLAFGSWGSSTGIVPPFTTVMYEVEISQIN